MNIFISTDYTHDFAILADLPIQLQEFMGDSLTILTTNRHQDRIFIEYAILNGFEYKVYNIRDCLTDEVIKKISTVIDHLLIYSQMSNYFFMKLYEYCDSTLIVDGQRMHVEEYKKVLIYHYSERMVDTLKSKDRLNIDYYGLYTSEFRDKLRDVPKVKVIVRDLINY